MVSDEKLDKLLQEIIDSAAPENRKRVRAKCERLRYLIKKTGKDIEL